MAAGGDLRLEVPYGGVPQWLAARRLAPEGGGVREVLALRRRATPLMAAAADVVRAALPPGTRVEDGEVLLGDYDAVWVALLEDATRRGVAGRTLFGAYKDPSLATMDELRRTVASARHLAVVDAAVRLVATVDYDFAAAVRDAEAADGRYSDVVAAATAARSKLAAATAGLVAECGGRDEAAIRAALAPSATALADGLAAVAAACRADGVADGVRLFRRFTASLGSDPIAATLPHLVVSPAVAARLPWHPRDGAGSGATGDTALASLAAFAGVDGDPTAAPPASLADNTTREALECDAVKLRAFLAQRAVITADGRERTAANDPFVGVPPGVVDAATNVPRLLAATGAVHAVVAALDAPALRHQLRLAGDPAFVETTLASRLARLAAVERLTAHAAACDVAVDDAARARSAVRTFVLPASWDAANRLAQRIAAELSRMVGGHSVEVVGLPPRPLPLAT